MSFFKGLVDSDDVGGSLNPDRFNFIDPDLTNKTFFLTPNQPPWADGEPNDEDSENAVE